MRTDVKLGFVIGGILLAVMVVYAVVVGRGGSGVPDQLALTNPPTETKVDATTDLGTATDQTATSAATEGASTSVPPAAPLPDEPVATAPLQTITPTSVQPTSPAPVATEAATPASKWNWDRLLHEGAAPEPMMSSAQTSGTGSASVTDTTRTEPTAPTNDITPVAYNNTAGNVTNPGFTAKPQPTVIDVPMPSPATRPTTNARTHTVAAGETLSTISFAAYGTSKHWPEIAKANPTINANKLKVGTVVTLPTLADATRDHAALIESKPVAEKPVDATKQYKVLPGDSLHKIAMKLYGKTDLWEKIYEANKVAIGADPAKLKAGAILSLPEAPAKAKQAN